MRLIKASLIFIIFAAQLYLITGCSLLGKDENKESRSFDCSIEGPILVNQAINTVKVYKGDVYAGTDNGLVKIDLENESCTPLGPEGADVETFISFSDQHHLASVYFSERDSTVIAKTTDGGERWIPFQNGYGGKIGYRPYAMVKHPSKERIYAGGGQAVVAESKDRGLSWDVMWNSWDVWGGGLKLFYIDENNGNIWAGGMNAYIRGALFVSKNGGNIWEERSPNFADGWVYDMMVHPQNSDTILAGSDVGIWKTKSGGNDYSEWERTDTGVVAITSIIPSPKKSSDMIYASGYNREETLFFLVSDDFGKSWTRIPIGYNEISVNDMIAVRQIDHDLLFFATNKGIRTYTYENVVFSGN